MENASLSKLFGGLIGLVVICIILVVILKIVNILVSIVLPLLVIGVIIWLGYKLINADILPNKE